MTQPREVSELRRYLAGEPREGEVEVPEVGERAQEPRERRRRHAVAAADEVVLAEVEVGQPREAEQRTADRPAEAGAAVDVGARVVEPQLRDVAGGVVADDAVPPAAVRGGGGAPRREAAVGVAGEASFDGEKRRPLARDADGGGGDTERGRRRRQRRQKDDRRRTTCAHHHHGANAPELLGIN